LVSTCTARDVTAGRLDVLAYRDVAARVVREFGVKQVAITLRESYSASRTAGVRCCMTARRACSGRRRATM